MRLKGWLCAGVLAALAAWPGSAFQAEAASPPAKKERIWYVTQPPYPYVARETQDQGHGEVQVTTNGQGNVVTAKMKVSTGSQVLDDNTIYHALKWYGPPDSTKAISVGYELTEGRPRPGKIKYFTPLPPYPEAARHLRQQGSGVAHISTDALGNVSGAYMLRSTGNSVLDENTIKYAKAKWRGIPNSKFNVPITYRIR